MKHEYTDECYDNWDELQSMKKRYAKNQASYPKYKWRNNKL